jgi:hypothetical protein
MDQPCQRIHKNLGIVKGYSLNEIVQITGYSRKTVFQHLKHLVDDGLVTRGDTSRLNQIFESENRERNPRGRPKVLYRKKRANANSLNRTPAPKGPTVNQIIKARNSEPNLPPNLAVEIEFTKLQKICRYEKGGKCKQKKDKFTLAKCTLSICPLKLHARLVK